MHSAGGNTLLSVLFVAVLNTIYYFSNFSLIVYTLFTLQYINNVCRTLLLGLSWKQNGHPIGYITPLSLILEEKSF